MPTIGKFNKTKAGFEGHISTLTMDCDVSLIPNENKKHEDSPDFFVKSGQCDLGFARHTICLLYTSPSPRDRQKSRMPSSA